MLLDHGEVSGCCAELQPIINDFTGARCLDFPEALVNDELVENSSEGWGSLSDVGLVAVDSQQLRLQCPPGGSLGWILKRTYR
jgi:hypothetical protein